MKDFKVINDFKDLKDFKHKKKGVPPYSNLVNLKSNTMKNTVQIYELFPFTQTIPTSHP